MKRIMRILTVGMIGLLLFSIMPSAFAEETDFFYYPHNNEKLNEYIENKSDEDFKRTDIRALEWDRDSAGPQYNSANRYIAKGEEIDPAKISHGYDEMWVEYDWTAEKIIKFLQSENKAEYLKNLEIVRYHVPLYYDGKRTTIVDYIGYLKEKGVYYNIIQSGEEYGDSVYQEFVQKDKLLLRMGKEGLSGFTPIQFIRYFGFHFVAAEKDGAYYLIDMPTEVADYTKEYAELEGFEEFDAKFGDYMEKKCMTVAQAAEMLPALEEAVNKRRAFIASQPPEERQMGGTSQTDAVAETTEGADLPPLSTSEIEETTDETPGVSVWLWLIPLCAAVLIGATVTVIIVIRKKKRS